MRIIKLSATDSTNVYLKNLMLSENLDDFTAVVANEQFTGKGQMNAIWQSEAGKNLTFSVLKRNGQLLTANQFHISICVSLAIVEVLKRLKVPDLAIKWPNDILSGTSKICGILIENSLVGNSIASSIIGIGLNVNQLEFPGLGNVSSIKLLMGKTIDLEELLQELMLLLQDRLSPIKNGPVMGQVSEYENLLFRKDKPSTFRNKAGELIMGFIKGVSADGKLRVAHEDNILKEYDLKEIRLLY